MVEAAGFEPASGHGDSAGTTCLVRCCFLPRRWLRTAAPGPVSINLADTPGKHGLAAESSDRRPFRIRRHNPEGRLPNMRVAVANYAAVISISTFLTRPVEPRHAPTESLPHPSRPVAPTDLNLQYIQFACESGSNLILS